MLSECMCVCASVYECLLYGENRARAVRPERSRTRTDGIYRAVCSAIYVSRLPSVCVHSDGILFKSYQEFQFRTYAIHCWPLTPPDE